MGTIILKCFLKNWIIAFLGEIKKVLVFGALEVPPEI